MRPKHVLRSASVYRKGGKGSRYESAYLCGCPCTVQSEIHAVNTKENNAARILGDTSAFARRTGLDVRAADELRLLAEELLGMLPWLMQNAAGEFWVENSAERYELHVALKARLSADERRDVLGMRQLGKDEPPTTLASRLRRAVEKAFAALTAADLSEFREYVLRDSHVPEADTGTYAGSAAIWALSAERDAPHEEEARQWDELEKHVIARFASDVLVEIRGRHVEIIVVKDFSGR